MSNVKKFFGKGNLGTGSVGSDITRRATGVGVDMIQKVEAVIYIMADKFLESKEMEKLKEEIKMTRLGQMLFYDGVAKGEVRGRAEGERSLLIHKVCWNCSELPMGRSMKKIEKRSTPKMRNMDGIHM